MSEIIETVLLCALPASGKSEARSYLDSLSAEERREHFHLGQTVQLDDYPYVHFMRCVDQALAKLGEEYVFFNAPDKKFKDPYNWGTLIALLNMDYRDLEEKPNINPFSAAHWLFWRMDIARKAISAETLFEKLPIDVISRLSALVEVEARKILDDKMAGIPDTLEGKTVVIEFARGGPDGASFPLDDPLGYQYSLRILSDKILDKAAMLYIWVTPEESRRKNEHRADPNDPGSILHHGVPIFAMMNDYGCDDIDHLLSESDRPDTIMVQPRGKTFYVPVGRFDNRVDLTTFIRSGDEEWKADDVAALRKGMKEAFAPLWEQYKQNQ